MLSKSRVLLGAVLLVAACAQEAAWKSACGCAFSLTDEDMARAQIVALDGDRPAMEALQNHYGTNGPDDEASLWNSRIANRSRFAASVTAANKHAEALGLPKLDSSQVANWHRAGEKGEVEAIRSLAHYLTSIGLADESGLWRNRLNEVQSASSNVRDTESMISEAEATQEWSARAPLIETAHKKIGEIKKEISWLPEDSEILGPLRNRLKSLVRARYAIDKRSLSYEMCTSANLEEEMKRLDGSDMRFISCDYAKGKYPFVIPEIVRSASQS